MAFNAGGGGGISGATDVSLSGVANDQVLTYASAAAKWTNKAGGSPSIANLPAGVTLTVRYVGSWPARPTARTDITVQWMGGTSAPPTGVNGSDLWISAAGAVTVLGQATGGGLLPPNPTGGSGGAYTDRTGVSFSSGGVTSTYHIYGTNISGSSGSPVGVVIHLHGDGAEEYFSPSGTLADYNTVAKDKNMLFVAPLTPDAAGSRTWWESKSSTDWMAALIDQLYMQYNIDRNRVWFTGYSGGAEAISYFMMRYYHARWTGGGAILLAGGGTSGMSSSGYSWTQSLFNNFEMHWVVGSRDSPAQGGDDGGFDAVAASLGGYNYYTARGFAATTRTVLSGLDHYQAESHGPSHLATHIK